MEVKYIDCVKEYQATGRRRKVNINNKGLSLKAADRHRKEIVVLGNEAYTLAIKKIQTEVSRLHELRAQGLRAGWRSRRERDHRRCSKDRPAQHGGF